MPRRPRDVGQDILTGFRQIKRGEVGRVITLPMNKPRKRKPDAPMRPEYDFSGGVRGKFAAMQQYLIVLVGTEPLIWRRILVPPGYSFWDLHVAIQDAMGWRDRHLHEFTVFDSKRGGSKRIGIPVDDSPASRGLLAGWETDLPARPESLRVPMCYVYDFGDGWEHVVVWEGFAKSHVASARPRCIAGERACPPEDCGGLPGFESFLEAIADAKHPEHRSMLEWVGGHYDPNAFDPKAVKFDDPEERWKKAFEKEDGEG